MSTYVYWLAIVSQLAYLFNHNHVGLSAKMMEDICAITNKCFNQMINKSPNDIYITAFFLNLCEVENTHHKSYLVDSISRTLQCTDIQEHQSAFYSTGCALQTAIQISAQTLKFCWCCLQFQQHQKTKLWLGLALHCNRSWRMNMVMPILVLIQILLLSCGNKILF